MRFACRCVAGGPRRRACRARLRRRPPQRLSSPAPSFSPLFRAQIIAAKEAGSAAPVKNIEGNTFLYTRHKDMFFVAVTRGNSNAELIFAFLYGASACRRCLLPRLLRLILPVAARARARCAFATSLLRSRLSMRSHGGHFQGLL
jgi:hypothetical protein